MVGNSGDTYPNSPALETFGYVRHHGNSGTAYLIAKSKIMSKPSLIGNGLDFPGQFSCLLPCLDIFKLLNLSHIRSAQVSSSVSRVVLTRDLRPTDFFNFALGPHHGPLGPRLRAPSLESSGSPLALVQFQSALFREPVLLLAAPGLIGNGHFDKPCFKRWFQI